MTRQLSASGDEAGGLTSSKCHEESAHRGGVIWEACDVRVGECGSSSHERELVAMMSVSAGLHVGGGDSGAWCECERCWRKESRQTLRRSNATEDADRRCERV